MRNTAERLAPSQASWAPLALCFYWICWQFLTSNSFQLLYFLSTYILSLFTLKAINLYLKSSCLLLFTFSWESLWGRRHTAKHWTRIKPGQESIQKVFPSSLQAICLKSLFRYVSHTWLLEQRFSRSRALRSKRSKPFKSSEIPQPWAAHSIPEAS